MSDSNEKKVRMSADGDTEKGKEVGQTRYQLYRKLFGRINSCLEKDREHETGVLLAAPIEAIAIEESLLSDRLDSCLTACDPDYQRQKDKKEFLGLAYLIKRFAALQANEPEKTLVGRMNQWRNDRNTMIHGLAKLFPADFKEGNDLSSIYSKRMAEAGKVAADGLKLVRDLDKWIRQARKQAER